MNKLISIIVPMYNEVKNIDNCLNALIKQSCQDFHVIFIDDGSTDGTYEYLNQILLQSNIRFSCEILRQSNAGAAKARENGILTAITTYVMIFDCDDKISENTVEAHMNSILHGKDIDIIMPNALIDTKDGYKNFSCYSDEKIYTGLECLEYSLSKWKVHGWVCAKKNIFEQSYNEYKKYNPHEHNYINNDEVITRLNFFFSKTVVRNHAIYFYQANQESTTKKIHPHRYLIFHNARILYFLFGKNMGLISINCHKELINSLWHTRGYFKSHKNQFSNKKEWKNEMRSMVIPP